MKRRIRSKGCYHDIPIGIAVTLSYANNINTVEGGFHLVGLRAALTRTINDYARRTKLLKDNDDSLQGEDVKREDLTAIVSVKRANPQFEGQTKG